MIERESSSAFPLLILALFGFGVAIWIHFYGQAARTLYPLVECTEHVNAAGIGTDWEIFTVAPLTDESEPVDAVVRQTLKRENAVVGKNLLEPATVLRSKDSRGTEISVSFQFEGQAAKIVSPPGDVGSALTIANRATAIELRCFQLEP